MAYDKNSKGEAFDWNAEISDEGGEFTVLEPGDYNFTVEGFTRKRFNGSDKMCACNQVVLKLRIDCPEGVTVEDNLFLNRKTEWKVSQFFLAIGQKQPGVPLRPNWDALPGSRGRCKLYIDKWKGNDGREFESNKVEKYYAPGAAPAQQSAPAPQQQSYQASAQQSAPQQTYQPQQQTMGGWNSGKF
jgi:hypothetical protein